MASTASSKLCSRATVRPCDAPAVSDPPSVSVMLVAVGRCLPGPAFVAAAMIMLGAMSHVRHHESRIVLLAHARQLLDEGHRRPKLRVAVIAPSRHSSHLDAVL